MKYIVRNCDKQCKMCEHIDNCLTKQVIEKCKIIVNSYEEDDDDFCYGQETIAENILDMFEIEEVKAE